MLLADQHPAPDPSAAATVVARFGGTGLSGAGPGAPWVAEFAVAELATALGLTAEGGKR